MGKAEYAAKQNALDRAQRDAGLNATLEPGARKLRREENSKTMRPAALARALGRAESGIHKMAKNGQIPRNSDGTFDLEAVKVAISANVRTKAGRAPAVSPSTDGEIEPAEARAAVERVRAILAEEGSPAAAGPLDYSAVRIAEGIVKIRRADLRVQTEAGRLVDADAIAKTIFAAFRIHRDALANWPARVSAGLAAECGGDAIKLAIGLEREIRALLQTMTDMDVPPELLPADKEISN